jgi:hypothetical protein
VAKGRQLAALGAHVGFEEYGPFVLAKGAQQFGLANPPATIEDEQISMIGLNHAL